MEKIYRESFGVIPLRKKENKWQVFLVQLRSGSHWGFPKGHPEPNETPEETAFRELKEETGLELIRFFQKSPLEESYTFTQEGKEIHKKVLYFVIEAKGEGHFPEEEIIAAKWCFFSEAYKRVTYEQTRSLLENVEEVLSLHS